MELKLLLTAHLATTILASILRNELNRNDQQLDSTLKQIVATVAETWPTHDVTIISHDNRSDNRVAQIADTISQTVSPLYPTCCFQSANLSSLKVNGHVAATSRSLVVFIYGARVAPTAKETVKIIQSVDHVTETKHVPRLLLILALDNNNSRIELCLKKLWKASYRRVVGVQVPSTSAGNKPLPPIIVHRYNPFVPLKYTQSTYNGDVSNWYVNQQQRGLEICQLNPPTKMQSVMLETDLLVLKEKLNASYARKYLHEKLHHCDLTYNLVFQLIPNPHNSWMYTGPVYTDRLCLYVPAMVRRASRTMVSWSLIVAFLVGVLIVGIVLGFSRLIDAATFGQPFNVIAVILGMSLDSLRLPTGAEKVLYLCLVQVATRYMAMLYTEMFSEVAMAQSEVRINEFEDLYGLNLTIRVSLPWYNHFRNNSIVPADLMPMFQTEMHPNKTDANFGFFSTQVQQSFLQELFNRSGVKSLPTNLCLGSLSAVHKVAKKWLFKDPVDDLLLRINQYGFRGHANSWNTKGTGHRDDKQGVVDTPSSQRRMVTALLYGYLLVLVVFVGELVVWWIRMRIGAGGVVERPGDLTRGRRVTVMHAMRALE